jgi:hypothetical protein
MVGPLEPHAGPYDQEISQLIFAAGLVPKQVFSAAEYRAPSGVVFLLALVPSRLAAHGSSFDFEEGPIIENAVFPIAVHATILRNNLPYDSEIHVSFVGYNQFSPPLPGDGASHVLMAFAENDSFVPGVPANGTYTYDMLITDATASGWRVSASFRVTPAP